MSAGRAKKVAKNSLVHIILGRNAGKTENAKASGPRITNIPVNMICRKKTK